MIELRQYIDRQGRNPFDRWFEKLDNTTQARIVIALDRLERGNFSAAKGVGAGMHNLPEIAQEIRWGKAGLNLILHSSDVGLFRRALHRNLSALREGLEEDAAVGEATQLII